MEGWLEALASADPFLPVAADPATEAALLGAIQPRIRGMAGEASGADLIRGRPGDGTAARRNRSEPSGWINRHSPTPSGQIGAMFRALG